jgi:hypothetical protein
MKTGEGRTPPETIASFLDKALTNLSLPACKGLER